MSTISSLSAGDFTDAVPDLADLLADAVAGGASLGFLEPFEHAAAAAWWAEQATRVADGSLLIWVASDPDQVSGRDRIIATIGLVLERKPNGRHRAEVIKLMVQSGARGRGLSRNLLGAAEAAARAAGRSLLLLDTETASVAEHVYRTGGWTRYGIVPDYAADPAGVPRDCSFYYKQLR